MVLVTELALGFSSGHVFEKQFCVIKQVIFSSICSTCLILNFTNFSCSVSTLRGCLMSWFQMLSLPVYFSIICRNFIPTACNVHTLQVHISGPYARYVNICFM
jgi:hypothetical protein